MMEENTNYRWASGKTWKKTPGTIRVMTWNDFTLLSSLVYGIDEYGTLGEGGKKKKENRDVMLCFDRGRGREEHIAIASVNDVSFSFITWGFLIEHAHSPANITFTREP